MQRLGWSFGVFKPGDAAIRARSGSKGSSVLEVRRKTSSGWKGRGTAESRRVNGAIGGGQRGWAAGLEGDGNDQ